MMAPNPNTRSDIECIIFDCDGTLVDSEELGLEAFRQTLSAHGVSISLNELKVEYQGQKIHNTIRYVFQQHGKEISEEGIEPFITMFRATSKALFEQELTLIDGANEVLHYAHAKGIKVCIASNGPYVKMKTSLKVTGLDKFFTRNNTFSAFDVDSWKPEPDLIWYSAKKMNVDKDKCLFVDDTVIGATAGVNAKVKTLYLQHEGNPSMSNVITINNLKETLNYL
ncbi:HAD-IA family hydrolase [Vibrio sp.]|nr:HAD-IA family hydrolase [Vibrio sp.]